MNERRRTSGRGYRSSVEEKQIRLPSIVKKISAERKTTCQEDMASGSRSTNFPRSGSDDVTHTTRGSRDRRSINKFVQNSLYGADTGSTLRSTPWTQSFHRDTPPQSLTGQVVGGESREPFSCPCRHCGVRFGKHSIAIHEKKCVTRQHDPNGESAPSQDEIVATTTTKHRRPVATIVTIGLGATQCEKITLYESTPPPRPKTQTLHESSLRDSGYGLPYVPPSFSSSEAHCSTSLSSADTNKSDDFSQGMTLCNLCGRVFAASQANVHRRLCRPDGQLRRLSTTRVKFPSKCDLLKVERSEVSKRQPRVSPAKRPPTVVCYICGREYGTKSIAIHEPQCLKKFETENRKLPISQRKPLPKKPVERNTRIARLFSVEDLAIMNDPDTTPCKGISDDRMDLIFQQCYSDFERELVPCKRCGRRFAPDRHEKHEPTCNAKPISSFNRK